MIRCIPFKLALLIFMLSVAGSLKSQDFTPEQVQMINGQVLKLASDYQVFSQFTEDGIKVSPFYKKKFKLLFHTENEQMPVKLFNDMDVENKGPAMLDLDEYIQTLTGDFPSGVAVRLDAIQISEPDKDDKNDKFVVTFQAEKTIMGLYQNKLVFNKSSKLFFKVEFIELSDKVYDQFIIREISNTPFKIKKRRIKDHELNLFVSAGKSALSAKNPQLGNEQMFSPGLGFKTGIRYNYFVNNQFGIGTGIGFSKYNATSFLSNFEQSYDAIDSENENYVRTVNGLNINETYGILYAEVPLNIHYRLKLSERFQFQLSAGSDFCIKLSDQYQLNGIYSYSGFYPRLNATLANLPEYNFASNEQTTYSGNLDLSPVAVLISGQLSVNYVLDYKSKVYMSVMYNRNMMDISGNTSGQYIHSTSENEFNSLLNSGSSVDLQYLCVELGFIFKIKKK